MPRLVHTSSAATLGEAPGTVGREDTPHRGWYLSTYERTKTEGERAVLAAARETGQDVVFVNPSSVQGPGRAGGTGRFLLAFLDGRMKVFVQTNVSLVDIGDCVEGHLLAAERGQAGERYLLNGMTLTLTEALALAAEVAGVQRKPRLLPRPVATVAAGVVERGFRLARRPPPVCREMVRTLLHGHRYDGSRAERELGLRYTDPRETRAPHGRLGAVGRTAEEHLGRATPRSWKTSASRSSICCSRSETSSARKPRKPPSLAALAVFWAAVFSHSRNWSASSGVVFSTSSALTARSSRGSPRPLACPWA